MTELLTKLYYGQIDIANEKPPIKVSKNEDSLYEQLREKLSEKQFQLFEAFLLCYANRYSTYQEFAFKQGVKLGFELAKELEKIEI